MAQLGQRAFCSWTHVCYIYTCAQRVHESNEQLIIGGKLITLVRRARRFKCANLGKIHFAVCVVRTKVHTHTHARCGMNQGCAIFARDSHLDRIFYGQTTHAQLHQCKQNLFIQLHKKSRKRINYIAINYRYSSMPRVYII